MSVHIIPAHLADKIHLKRDEVAALLRKRPDTISRWAKSGKFPPPVRLGAQVVWARAAVERFLAELESSATVA
jgi:predicted DNA-binding transcriptional regulator AlpA